MANTNRSASRNPNLGLAVVCVAIFIMVIDNTVLNIALPALSRDLGASNSDLQWIVDAYTFVYSGILLTAGSLGDRCTATDPSITDPSIAAH
ncbi:MAG: hypothetical protein AB7V43_03260 [Acidimicrobiia bacterium]